MEERCFIDTHVLIWLYNRDVERFSSAAQRQLDRSQLLVSPISLLELDYLYEIQRIKKKGQVIYQDLHQEMSLELAEDSYVRIIETASLFSQTRDPFDRLLIAHAKLRNLPIITKDRAIREIYAASVW